MTNMTKNKGFTLIEILVALAITAIVLSAIYAAYQSQHKTYITQEAVAEFRRTLQLKPDHAKAKSKLDALLNRK